MTTIGKKSIAEIVDPMLVAGASRAEIKAAIKEQRPEFKCPSAAIGNRMRAMREKGTRINLPYEERKMPERQPSEERAQAPRLQAWKYHWPTEAELATIRAQVRHIWA